jgi:hypothetical protein
MVKESPLPSKSALLTCRNASACCAGKGSAQAKESWYFLTKIVLATLLLNTNDNGSHLNKDSHCRQQLNLSTFRFPDAR